MIDLAKQWIEQGRNSALARNSGWMFLGYGLKIIVQAGYFILIARSLGPAQYGAFIGTVAFIALASPFGGIGSGNLLVQNVSRNKDFFAEYWGNALLVSVTSGILLLALILSVAHFALPPTIPVTLIILVGLADILAVKGAEMGAQAFQATDQIRYTAFFTFLPYILRLIGALVAVYRWGHPSALQWGWIYFGCTVVSCAVALSLVRYKIGAPKIALWRIPREIEQGFYFSASMSAQTIYNDIDKTMLARLSTLAATGTYAAAYRLIDVAFAPVRSVLNAAYANFFRHGELGIAATYSYAKSILPKMIGYSLLIFVGMLVAAPVIPVVLGKEYAGAVEALRWLALLPLFKSLHYFLADSLTGAGYQRIRVIGQTGVAIFNVLLNLWLIPAYSWRGAAWASLASDAALVLAMYASVMFLMSKEARLGIGFSGQRVQQS
jgi:O-antigen/teichoic acid export membrane protein